MRSIFFSSSFSSTHPVSSVCLASAIPCESKAWTEWSEWQEPLLAATKSRNTAQSCLKWNSPGKIAREHVLWFIFMAFFPLLLLLRSFVSIIRFLWFYTVCASFRVLCGYFSIFLIAILYFCAAKRTMFLWWCKTILLWNYCFTATIIVCLLW